VNADGPCFRALRSALELANVVADDRYRLYEEFVKPAEKSAGTGGRTLEEYLGYVRAAVLNGLEDRGGSDPWRVVKV
jgi:nuclear pore complex protein Nup107